LKRIYACYIYRQTDIHIYENETYQILSGTVEEKGRGLREYNGGGEFIQRILYTFMESTQ
jgi:hypothetical protein